MSDDPSRTHSPIRMISVRCPEEIDDFDYVAARLLRQSRATLMRARFRAIRGEPIPDGLPGILAGAVERDEIVFIVREPGPPGGRLAVEVWLAREEAGQELGARRWGTARNALDDIFELAGFGCSVSTVRPAEANDWLDLLQRDPRCVLVIISRADSAIMTDFDPPRRPPSHLRRAAPPADALDRMTRSAPRGSPAQSRPAPPARSSPGHYGHAAPQPAGPAAARAPAAAAGGTYGHPTRGGYNRAVSPAGPSQRPPDVPKSARDEPLPHDGLFIRRNNAFGTKSTLGITDLIEQGVLIDQTQIRFDDFIASHSDGVPLPQAGEALSVSHGYAAAPSVAKAYHRTTHFLEVALRAADNPADGTPHGQPLPVNFVFVVDTSLSMAGDKLKIVQESIRQLYDQLRDNDILGVVSFDTTVRTVLRATRKADLRSDQLMDIVYGLRAGGGTDLNLGVLYGIDEIGRHARHQSDLVNCLYLFSDGDPTSGETNWLRIRSNIAAQLRGDLTITCFGFGADARIRELEALAGSAGGHFTFVSRPEDVKLNLGQDLKRREHLAAINIQLQIEIAPEIKIWHLYGHDLVTDPAVRAAVIRGADEARRKGKEEFGTEALPDLITQEKGIRIFAPDLAFGETYWIVFELEAPDGANLPSLGRARVQYVDTLARDNRRHDLALTPAGGAIPDSTVVVHAVGLWTSEITFYALDDLYADDRVTAKERLTRHANTLRSLHQMVPARQFLDDQVTVFKLVSLSGNLGRPVAWADSGPRGGTAWDYGVYALNKFGQVRAGYNRVFFGP